MSDRSFGCVVLAAAITAILLLRPAPAAGQSAAPTAKSSGAWSAPRTPDGVPDLQGVWTNNTVTPLERPKGLGEKEFYTEAELADVQKREGERLAKNEIEGLPAANHSGVEGAPADNVHYDFAQFGLDRSQS